MSWFKKSNTVLLQEHKILDNGIEYCIDSAYAVKGQTEGWLTFIHGVRDYRGVYVATYIHNKESV